MTYTVCLKLLRLLSNFFFILMKFAFYFLFFIKLTFVWVFFLRIVRKEKKETERGQGHMKERGQGQGLVMARPVEKAREEKQMTRMVIESIFLEVLFTVIA